MIKHFCPECHHDEIDVRRRRINPREGEPRNVWWAYCDNCGTEFSDRRTPQEALDDCDAIDVPGDD